MGRIPPERLMGRFLWHPDARLIAADGNNIDTPPEISGAVPDRPAARALGAAFTGSAFRIGAEDAPAPSEGFETLTSGSTGAPRRIARDAPSWLASFAINAALFGTGPGVRVAVLGRLVQSLSLYGAVEALHLGATLHLLEGIRPDRQRQALAARQIGLLWASPPQLQLLVEAGGPALPALRHVLIGGAKLEPGLRRALAEIAPGAELREFYGAAEASFITLADADTPPLSVGKPYPGVEIGIGSPGGQTAEGRVWVRSPYLFRLYAGTDKGVAEWRDGWLGLGEVGRMEAGHLFLLGRADRMVTVAGQNTYPEAMEGFLQGLFGVHRAAVLARPDAKRGHVMEAVLVGDADQEPAILSALRTRFGVLAAPKRLHWRSDWPMLASSKPDLGQLARDIGI